MALPRDFTPDRALARAKKLNDDPITFKRGLNYPFADLRDGVARHMDVGKMARR